ncbi:MULTISPECIES: diacylglycerol kinase [Cellulophaga]|jgi:diacylglycerol kinase (ATP)|uniref:Diacylglycerol kinase n=1 Tax=Cellulophaga baltica 18 TaxID=1348584 RepID=A0AAU8RH33_9FLAO|nr:MULTISPECIES: diacylglycerol kinase family protein [Cellulophaga]AIY14349.1 diacylglycerol kinase [Cellulophaga baltica NN016038]AIZ42717.1 diacylglycerol kinase [Cellulophaga baltica 18]KGK30539.1 diacylglycerol kinase [Cellulophaga sp. E6(2014)]MBA6316481.1 diacylglycerol kinase family protein [Cellulophaga baltica]MCR1026389.1 diacylglycerol kinase family protein [Cellulophaga baltica]
MPKKESFLVNRIKSVGFALRGAVLLIRTEASIKIQVFIAIVMTIAGFYFEITKTEWILQIFAIALVLGVEGMNTAVEKISDYIQPEFDKKIGFIKDIAAGAVMLVSIASTIIGMIIYLPKIF